jgi:vacuolar-type H+-ATPase subunit I/STV1
MAAYQDAQEAYTEMYGFRKDHEETKILYVKLLSVTTLFFAHATQNIDEWFKEWREISADEIASANEYRDPKAEDFGINVLPINDLNTLSRIEEVKDGIEEYVGDIEELVSNKPILKKLNLLKATYSTFRKWVRVAEDFQDTADGSITTFTDLINNEAETLNEHKRALRRLNENIAKWVEMDEFDIEDANRKYFEG